MLQDSEDQNQAAEEEYLNGLGVIQERFEVVAEEITATTVSTAKKLKKNNFKCVLLKRKKRKNPSKGLFSVSF